MWPDEIYSVKTGYCPALNVFEVLVDLLYKILQVCARNANPYWPSGQKKNLKAMNILWMWEEKLFYDIVSWVESDLCCVHSFPQASESTAP